MVKGGTTMSYGESSPSPMFLDNKGQWHSKVMRNRPCTIDYLTCSLRWLPTVCKDCPNNHLEIRENWWKKHEEVAKENNLIK